ncbi:Phosphatase dcr2 [Conoideocrella luteorostrata]|uniref:Phosphatase dcr2 n=1 Tax=Conoideocrella luteorostrata TaxID=1105319 RepID=A0AAJ0CS79_9HYPO|nr:Phosphatase dcr2 [Conoideocrella luteorostrata]
MEFKIVEATIQDLTSAFESGYTSTELVSRYLQRIATCDTRSQCLNSIVHLIPALFEEAAAADERRTNGSFLGLLDGIPYLLKDSFKYQGMTVSAGSPAFRNLLSNEDAFLA